MIKKTITYTDYNDIERTEDFYFNLNKVELMDLMLDNGGDLAEQIEKLIAAQEMKTVVEIFKEVVLKSYGEKSVDGKRFIKTPEKTAEFVQNPAYPIIFMELANNAKKAAEFINGIMPDDMKEPATHPALV